MSNDEPLQFVVHPIGYNHKGYICEVTDYERTQPITAYGFGETMDEAMRDGQKKHNLILIEKKSYYEKNK